MGGGWRHIHTGLVALRHLRDPGIDLDTTIHRLDQTNHRSHRTKEKPSFQVEIDGEIIKLEGQIFSKMIIRFLPFSPAPSELLTHTLYKGASVRI
jgi:hypothetical protein